MSVSRAKSFKASTRETKTVCMSRHHQVIQRGRKCIFVSYFGELALHTEVVSDPPHGSSTREKVSNDFLLLWALQYFCPEAAPRHSASFWRSSASTAAVEDAVICVQSSGRTSLGPPVLHFVPRCRLPSVPSLSPPLIISTLHRSSAALLLWAVICSAIVQYILPPRSHCRRRRPPPSPPPPAAISISVRPDFTASWICTFSSRLHNLVTASSLPAVSCCVCVSLFLSFFFLKMWCVVALFLFFC